MVDYPAVTSIVMINFAKNDIAQISKVLYDRGHSVSIVKPEKFLDRIDFFGVVIIDPMIFLNDEFVGIDFIQAALQKNKKIVVLSKGLNPRYCPTEKLAEIGVEEMFCMPISAEIFVKEIGL